MEGFGVFPEIFFNSFEDQMQLEDTEAMVQLLDSQLLGFKQFQDLDSLIWPGANCSSSLSDPNSSYEPMQNAMGEEILADSFFQIDSSYQFESLVWLNEANSEEFRECSSAIEQSVQNKRKFQIDECNESPKKKVQKRARNSQRKNGKSSITGGAEEKNAGLSTSSCSSEGGDSNDSHVSAVNEPNLKERSGRGVATDSQSVYAKKRRERINERLRILQNLVPNGTKVDISTMLEEAVQYVKFLQLQIKLLSSDELWMYAPLAYNGMNIGIDLMNP
ncbi:hypothetical protein KFK09_004460 [Dendrobium nobile]|uniref:BHLH domain-containing protein n=1 Tax=Dendrobium nobile TaxID=94219 RepID=A0A8T3C463_DENNO|nr:hypothetical protein KFK09_004460 [Dendrobium nobile]